MCNSGGIVSESSRVNETMIKILSAYIHKDRQRKKMEKELQNELLARRQKEAEARNKKKQTSDETLTEINRELDQCYAEKERLKSKKKDLFSKFRNIHKPKAKRADGVMKAEDAISPTPADYEFTASRMPNPHLTTSPFNLTAAKAYQLPTDKGRIPVMYNQAAPPKSVNGNLKRPRSPSPTLVDLYPTPAKIPGIAHPSPERAARGVVVGPNIADVRSAPFQAEPFYSNFAFQPHSAQAAAAAVAAAYPYTDARAADDRFRQLSNHNRATNTSSIYSTSTTQPPPPPPPSIVQATPTIAVTSAHGFPIYRRPSPASRPI